MTPFRKPPSCRGEQNSGGPASWVETAPWEEDVLEKHQLWMGTQLKLDSQLSIGVKGAER